MDEEEYRDCVHRLQSDNLELTEERLDLLGVDGKEILNDMVTHETIRLYLKNFHDATASNQFASASESADTIEQIHHRLRQILNSTLERHHRHGELPADPEIDSMVGVICPDCGVTVDAVKYLQPSVFS
ncbi:rod-determining factor RdfA [Halorubrum laminariae]|uniref:Rod-determining factor RdfA n=1 Tax=Halorubrum laminariae TaxID=1433523 RepID=A0ABD6C5B3_9EURY